MENKKKILIVEDDLLCQMVYKYMFAKDFNSIFCTNEDEFHSALKSDNYDLVLMDLSLGKGKDGIELIKELRQMESYKTVPIIAVTANVLKKDEEITMAAGATKFVHKPFNNTILLSDCKKFFAD